MATRFTMPLAQWISSLGVPGAGYKLYFYTTLTSTPLDTFSDDLLTVPNTNPVVADSTGTWGAIFLSGTDYKVVLTTSSGAVIATADPVHGGLPASVLVGPVGIDMTPVNELDITQTANAASIAQIQNLSTGVAAKAVWQLRNSTPTTASFTLNGGSFTTSGILRQDGAVISCGGTGGLTLATTANQPVYFGVNSTEYMRLTAARLAINNTLTSSSLAVQGTASDNVFTAYSAAANFMFAVNSAALGVGTGDNAANAMVNIRKDSTTNRSVNAAGTINASGADYAEYEKKAPGCGVVATGQIIGFDINGHITDVWASVASRFGVKSTDPTIVGGDKWGSEESLGMMRPVPPTPPEMPEILSTGTDFFADMAAQKSAQTAAQIQFDADTKAHEAEVATFAAKIEAARQTVDRIAYAGKCPCNVLGAAVGDYIVPLADGPGIKGVAVAVPTFDQYRACVGRVVSLLPGGLCTIALMVH